MNSPALSISEVSFAESTYKHNILLSCPFPNASNDYGVFLFVAIKSLVSINVYPSLQVRPQSHGIIRLVLYVIMYFIFYFSIGYGTAFACIPYVRYRCHM